MKVVHKLNEIIEVKLEFLENYPIVSFIIMMLVLCWAFYYLYKCANRFANQQYEDINEHYILFDIFVFLISVGLISTLFPFYIQWAEQKFSSDFFSTLVIPFPLYFIALYPITKNILKFFNENKKT